MPDPLNILYFGIYSTGPEYPRNHNLIDGLRARNVSVLQAHIGLAASHRGRMRIARHPASALRFLLGLAASYVALTWKFFKAPKVDAVIVGHPGYFHVHLARLLRNRLQKDALLIYDVFIPLYDALVEDRRLYDPKSRMARIIHRFERACCRTADICLIDTRTHCRYLVKEYGLCEQAVRPVFVGSTIRKDMEETKKTSPTPFDVLFFGTYIPLHGVHIILEAARILASDPDIRLTLVGSGQMKTEMVRLACSWRLKNVVFEDWIPPERLAGRIRSCDLCLGIFGSTAKAGRVIPSKVFDICHAGAPLITSDTPAIREAFVHGIHAWLVPANNAGALATAILELKNNPGTREVLARGAHRLSQGLFSLKEIGKTLVDIITDKHPPSGSQ